MKILQLNAVYGTGSTGRIIADLNSALRAKGHEVCAVVSQQSEAANGVFCFNSPLDLKLHAVLSRVFGKQAYFSSRATKKIINFIASEKPDVVHLHNLHANYVNLPMLLRFLASSDIAVAVTLHDCWFFTGKCTHYTLDGCYKWQQQCGGCPRLKNDNISFFFDKTAQMLADKKQLFAAVPRLAVIGVSDWITGEAKKSLLGNAKIVRRIYNWIDLNTFKPVDGAPVRQRLGLGDKKLVLSVASVWSNSKGLDKIIELAARLGAGARILLVGSLIKPLPLPENIIQIDRTDSLDELVEYYSAADVFFQPSLEETFGKVTAEALACGTPVVCFDSTANSELLGDGCGFLAQPSDMSAALAAIGEITQRGKAHYSQHCRSFALSNFDMQLLVDEHIKLYSELINSEKGM